MKTLKDFLTKYDNKEPLQKKEMLDVYNEYFNTSYKFVSDVKTQLIFIKRMKQKLKDLTEILNKKNESKVEVKKKRKRIIKSKK